MCQHLHTHSGAGGSIGYRVYLRTALPYKRESGYVERPVARSPTSCAALHPPGRGAGYSDAATPIIQDGCHHARFSRLPLCYLPLCSLVLPVKIAKLLNPEIHVHFSLDAAHIHLLALSLYIFHCPSDTCALNTVYVDKRGYGKNRECCFP